MFDPVRELAVKHGEIAGITNDAITTRETIGASAHAVAPRRIDTHFHSVDGLGRKIAARGGLTTPIDLSGTSD